MIAFEAHKCKPFKFHFDLPLTLGLSHCKGRKSEALHAAGEAAKSAKATQAACIHVTDLLQKLQPLLAEIRQRLDDVLVQGVLL